jgi:hypothetical protein
MQGSIPGIPVSCTNKTDRHDIIGYRDDIRADMKKMSSINLYVNEETRLYINGQISMFM